MRNSYLGVVEIGEGLETACSEVGEAFGTSIGVEGGEGVFPFAAAAVGSIGPVCSVPVGLPTAETLSESVGCAGMANGGGKTFGGDGGAAVLLHKSHNKNKIKELEHLKHAKKKHLT